MSNIQKIGLLLIGVVLYIVFSKHSSPTSENVNLTSIDPKKGYSIQEIKEGNLILANDGALTGLVPMREFICEGKVYKIGSDSQDGFSHNITLVFGELSTPEIFEYIINDGIMNKKFSNGFVLNRKYFQSHIAAFYTHPASDNLEKALNRLNVGDTVQISGNFTFLKTKNGVIKTSLNPEEFRCKYIYLKEISTNGSVYR